MRSLASAAALCVCAFLTGCGTLSERVVDHTDLEAGRYALSGDLGAEVESLARPLVEEGITPGIVVGVLSPGPDAAFQMRFFGYGVADKASGNKPDADTVFPSGSLSKGFLGAITASLVKEGILSWDDTLEKLLPPDVSLSDDAKKITVLQLATHTSGLPRQPITLETLAYFVQFLFTGENFYRHLDREKVLDYLADFYGPLAREPHYSNLGSGILGYVVETRTGRPLSELLNKYVLQPLGLKNTGYAMETLPRQMGRAHGYAGDQPKFMARGEPVPDWKFTELMKGSASAYSSARDLLTYAAAHLDSKAKTRSAFVDTVQVRFPRAREAAAVAWVVDEVEGRHIAYQTGYVAGYSSYIGLDLDSRTAVVVLQNTFNWTDSVGYRLLDRMARARKIADEKQRYVKGSF